MKLPTNKLLLALIALLAVYAAPLRAELTPPSATFFSPQYYLGDDANDYPVYYLDYFDTYTYDLSDSTYVYKYNFGWLYYFGGSGPSGNDDAYFYDYEADDVFYTSPDLYPYIYSFNLDTYLYYFEGSEPREFYDFSTDAYLYYPSL